MGWIANVFIVIGLWYIGERKRWALLLTTLGESIWVVYSFRATLYDLTAICCVFAVLNFRSYVKWGQA